MLAMAETRAPAPVGQPVVSLEDARLVEALRAGDEAAFVALVGRYGSLMLRVARLYVSNRSVAEEVVQEAWLGVVTGIGRFEGRSSFKTWLFRILSNTAKTRADREGRSVPFSSLAAAELGSTEAAVDADRFIPQGEPWASYWSSTQRRFDPFADIDAFACLPSVLPIASTRFAIAVS